jgi:hypothetical protein
MPKPHHSRRRAHAAHAEEFEYAAYQMLSMLSAQLGLKPLVRIGGYNGEIAAEIASRNGDGDGACRNDSVSPVANPTTKITKEDAQSVILIVRAWDTALERLRVLKGAPLPGSRRPVDPPPKLSKPRNRAPEITRTADAVLPSLAKAPVDKPELQEPF